MRTLVICACCILSALEASAQTETPAPAFEAADVHASPQGTRESGLYLHGSRVEFHGATMLHLIMAAYGVSQQKVFGGPNWLDTDRFDIVAKASGPVKLSTFAPML